MQENDIIYLARLHWIIFAWPAALLILALYVASTYYAVLLPSMVLAGIALVWLAMTWITYQYSSLLVKHKQVIVCTGIIVRQIIDMPYSKIETIDIRQNILGSLLGYGLLVITGTGGTRQYMNYIANPLTCRRYIEQTMHDQ